QYMATFAAEPATIVAGIFVFGVEQIKDGSAVIELAAAQASVEDGQTTAASEGEINPADGGNNAFGPAVEIRIRFGPGAVRKAVGNAAPYFENIHSEREFRHDDGVVGDVIQFGFEVNPRMIFIEADDATYCATAVEGSVHFNCRGERTPLNLNRRRLIAGGGEPNAARARRHLVTRIVVISLVGPLGDDDIGWSGEQFTARFLELEAGEGPGFSIKGGEIEIAFDDFRQLDG